MDRIEGVFRGATERREVEAGAVIFQEGDEGHVMFGVIDGSVALRVDGADVGRVGPDEVFGELALIDGTPRSRTAVAETDTTLAVIDEQTFLFLVAETPRFALQVMRRLSALIRSKDND